MSDVDRQTQHVSEVFKSAEQVYYRATGNSVYRKKERIGGTTWVSFEEGLSYVRSDTFVATENHR